MHGDVISLVHPVQPADPRVHGQNADEGVGLRLDVHRHVFARQLLLTTGSYLQEQINIIHTRLLYRIHVSIILPLPGLAINNDFRLQRKPEEKRLVESSLKWSLIMFCGPFYK